LKASDSKSDRGVSPSGVQILSPPPFFPVERERGGTSSGGLRFAREGARHARSAAGREQEGWPSGRRCGTGNAVYGQLYRGFESHPLRQFQDRRPRRFRARRSGSQAQQTAIPLAVLDGEVAVPCSPQSAIAGLNSLSRVARVE